MLLDSFTVDSPNVKVTEESIQTTYNYESTQVEQGADGKWVVRPTSTRYEFSVDKRVPKLG
jgi:myo-inositol-1-phosphate synthase